MKGFMGFVVVVLLGLTAYNWWEIRSLRQDIAALEQKVTSQQSGSVTDTVVAQATVALGQARQAISSMDWNRARIAYDDARKQLDQASKTAGDKAAPTVKWLEGQAAELGKQIKERVPVGR
jgi:hypothetical protein